MHNFTDAANRCGDEAPLVRSQVEFHRRGRFDATITLDDGRSFGAVHQGLV